MKTCNSERSKELIHKISSNSKKKTMTVIGLISLAIGIGFIILGITSVAKVNAAMNPDVPLDEFSRILDIYSPLEIIGFLFGIPAIIAGLVLSINGLKRYKVI